MNKKKLTINQYAKVEKTTGGAIRKRINRNTVKSKKINGIIFVYPETDTTIKKPRIATN
jgi:hypothetical protein